MNDNSLEAKPSCLSGCLGTILGAILGVAIAAIWIHFKTLSIQNTPEYLNSDGLNRYAGPIGAIVMGLFLGVIIGGIVGANWKTRR